MPAAIAIPAIATAIAGGASAGASIYGAHKQGQANNRALAFEREQAQQAAQDAEAARHANFDQWQARQQRLNTITGALGWGSQNIPAYVPGQVPNYIPGAQSRRDQVFASSGFGGPYRPGTIGSYLGG